MHFLTASTHAVRFAHFILLDAVILILLGEGCKLRNSPSLNLEDVH